jgi:hypothetical protein
MPDAPSKQCRLHFEGDRRHRLGMPVKNVVQHQDWRPIGDVALVQWLFDSIRLSICVAISISTPTLFPTSDAVSKGCRPQ